MKNKAPPRKRGGARANGPSSHQSVAPQKPRQQAGSTKSSPNEGLLKQKTRRLAMRNLRVMKEFCRVAYHDALFVRNSAMWIATRWSDELVHIVLLLIVIFLQYRIHAIALLPHH